MTILINWFSVKRPPVHTSPNGFNI
jgi:hypothetical protein